MAACSSNKSTPPSVLEERVPAPGMLAFGVQNMCVLGYDSTACEAPAPAKPSVPLPPGILKKSKHVPGGATASLVTLTGTTEPSCPRVRFSLEERVHVYSDATAGLATTPALAAAASASSTSSGRKRRRSEAERLKDFDMKEEAFYSNRPTLPRFQILWPDFVYRNPNRGKQPKDCNKKDPDYNPKDKL